MDYESQMGTCRFCGQDIMINAPEGMSRAELDRMAVETCNCKGAKLQRMKEKRRDKAYEYIAECFGGRERMEKLMRSAVDIVFDDEADSVTIKQDGFTYKIKRNKEGYIELQDTYKKTNTEEF